MAETNGTLPAPGPIRRIASATPTKDFFVSMITRDIALEDCLLDLIDNCLDGAQRMVAEDGELGSGRYSGYRAELTFDTTSLNIKDNCGGIPLALAENYAFHFGRPRAEPVGAGLPIGLYGIGMKRAILKLGTRIRIDSSTASESFQCFIDVDEWSQHDEWTFELSVGPPLEEPGTTISVTELNDGVSEAFGDGKFVSDIKRIVSRDYARVIDHGFEVKVDGEAISAQPYHVKESEEFSPFRTRYKDGIVQVEIIAGMAASPPDSPDPDDRVDVSRFGWFVFCNDRVVLAADKSSRTVWGWEGSPRWHTQYNGFVGILLFSSQDPTLLPWTTTKRDLDSSSFVYRRAQARMKDATLPWIAYTNARKVTPETVKPVEDRAQTVSAFDAKPSSAFTVPTIERARIAMTSIQYRKPVREVKRAIAAFGKGYMTNKAVGEKTFDYFLENEAED